MGSAPLRHRLVANEMVQIDDKMVPRVWPNAKVRAEHVRELPICHSTQSHAALLSRLCMLCTQAKLRGHALSLQPSLSSTPTAYAHNGGTAMRSQRVAVYHVGQCPLCD